MHKNTTCGQVNHIICVQECSDAWQDVIIGAMKQNSPHWDWVKGQLLFIAFRSDRFKKVSSAMHKVFPEPADANNERRKFRQFQQVCDLVSATDHMSSNAYKDVAISFDVSFSGTYINL